MTTFRNKLAALSAPLLVWMSALPVSAQSQGLQNPLTSQSVTEFIASALKVLVIVALPIITLFIVIAGFMFVFARGNESKLSDAKKNFVYVVIGALLILGAWVIATLIGGTVSQLIS
jgi:ABC-type multidrug transport system permease subunit